MEEKKTYQIGREKKTISSSKREKIITKKSHKHFLNA
jgi:hypothetical protein